MRGLLIIFVASLLFPCCKKGFQNIDNPNPNNDVYTGPVPKPSTGYGSDGPYTVAKVSFPSPHYAGKNVEIFYPEGITNPKPTIFYSHAFGGEESSYNIGLYNFIAKKGYAVVFAPYPTTGVSIDDRYNTLWQSFDKAVQLYPHILDTSRVGFMGHSFGGGASFGLGYKGFVDKEWGQNGRFIFAMAQWYSYQLSDVQLQNFPSNTKLITEVYNDDVTNDHRMAIDIFKRINIPNSEIDFLLVEQSVLPNYTYTADHSLPNTRTAFDAYDYYCLYRLLDALMDYSFNGTAAGKNVALGNGSTAQVTLPSYNRTGLKPLIETDNASPLYPQSKYLFPCSNGKDNPRIANCN